jgi:capsular polysaccharide biosynthesis protein
MSSKTSSSTQNKARVVEQNADESEGDAGMELANNVRTAGDDVIAPVHNAPVYTDVTNLLRVLVMNGWIIVLLVVLGVGASYLYTRAEPVIYQADGKIMIVSPETTEEDLRNQLSVINELNTSIVGNYVQLLRTRTVLNAAREALAGKYDAAMIEDAEVEIIPVQNSTFITIEVRSTDRMLSSDMVSALIDSAIANTPQSLSKVFPIQVIDTPLEGRWISPNVRMSLVFGALGSAAVGIALAFLFDYYRQYRRRTRVRA